MNKYVVSSTKEVNKNNNVILINVKEFESDMKQIIKQYPDAKVGIYVPKQKIQAPDKLDLILDEIKSMKNDIKSINLRLDKIDNRIDNLVKKNNLKE